MADVHHLISLAIGSPSDIPHFILFGLSTNENVPDAVSFATITVPSRPRTIIVPSNQRVIR